MAMDPQKLIPRWKFYKRKSQSKSLRKVMAIHHPNIQPASVSTIYLHMFVFSTKLTLYI